MGLAVGRWRPDLTEKPLAGLIPASCLIRLFHHLAAYLAIGQFR